MIDWLDLTLRELLVTRVPFLDATPPTGIADEQVGFQPPDRHWKSVVDAFAPKRALNLYLVDVRENRFLRSNEPLREVLDGTVLEHPAPHRLDCHYLLSAWSPASEADGKTTDEHRLLYDALAVLLENRPLVPATVFAAGLPPGFPAAVADAELPATVAPPEGFGKVPEFWGSLERNLPWKPSVLVVVTVPVIAAPFAAGPPVTTLTGRYAPGTGAGGYDTVLDVGGIVFDLGGAPVVGAWVRLETPGGDVVQEAVTRSHGRFVFTRLAPQSYVFRAGAAGVGTDQRTLDVPSTSGEYHLQLS